MQRHKKLYGLSVLLAVGVGGLSGFLSRNGMIRAAGRHVPCAGMKRVRRAYLL